MVQPSPGLALAEVIRAASPLQGFSTGASSSMMAIRPDALEAVLLDFRAIDLEEESKIDHFYSYVWLLKDMHQTAHLRKCKAYTCQRCLVVEK